MKLNDKLHVFDPTQSDAQSGASVPQVEAERGASDLPADIGGVDDIVARQRDEIVALRREVAKIALEIEAMRHSSSWRLTAPLRDIARRFPEMGANIRRALRLIYWTITLQLPQRLRERRYRQQRLNKVEVDNLRHRLGLPDEVLLPPAPSGIVLPVPQGRPQVSVIIPTYGQVEYTLRCLASLAAALPSVSMEVIVVDDASGDPAVAQLRDVAGITLVERQQNLGFLRSCNDAARLATGDALFFLNNDTEVMPGAIDALWRLLQQRPDAGMVGARLLYPDGVQQEAGGIIWRDGTGWNYGNRDDPRRPEYCYVREVDYISGAAIMLPRARWDEMGGFDEAFVPAYCEDSDLAFRLRRAGWKVLYQPSAFVVHHEGVSHGTDTASGIKAHQVHNTALLAERWAHVLEREAQLSGQNLLRARDRAAGRRVTLVVDHYVPEPDRDAGSRTMMSFLEGLLQSGRVVKFFPGNYQCPKAYGSRLQQMGIEVLYRPYVEDLADWLAVYGGEIDEVLLSRPDIATLTLPALTQYCRARLVYYGHDLHHARLRLIGGAEPSRERIEIADRMESTERRIWRMVDTVLYPSAEEVAVVRSLEPGVNALVVTPFALPPAPPPRLPPAVSGGLIFVAGFGHPPNEDAAIWLVREILPLIRRRYPNIHLAIVGSNPTQAVQALAGDRVEVTGFVSDAELERRYQSARLAICPMRIGAGVKLKVVEAMSRALPIVTTSIGAQGLDDLAAICDVADAADELAEYACRLLADDSLWCQRSIDQSHYVSARFSTDAIRRDLCGAFDSLHAQQHLAAD